MLKYLMQKQHSWILMYAKAEKFIKHKELDVRTHITPYANPPGIKKRFYQGRGSQTTEKKLF